jgi:hypothetical protein
VVVVAKAPGSVSRTIVVIPVVSRIAVASVTITVVMISIPIRDDYAATEQRGQE